MLNAEQITHIKTTMEVSFFNFIEDDKIDIKDRVLAYHAIKSPFYYQKLLPRLKELELDDVVINAGYILDIPNTINPSSSDVYHRAFPPVPPNMMYLLDSNNRIYVENKGVFNIARFGKDTNNAEVKAYVHAKIDEKLAEHMPKLLQSECTALIEAVSAEKDKIEAELHHLCIDYNEDEFDKFIEKNKNKSYDINAKSIFGFPPIFWAALRPDLRVAKKLLSLGASANILSDDGISILEWAKHLNNSTIIIDLFTPLCTIPSKSIDESNVAKLSMTAQLFPIVATFSGYCDVSSDNFAKHKLILEKITKSSFQDKTIEEIAASFKQMHLLFQKNFTGIRDNSFGDALNKVNGLTLSTLIQAYMGDFTEYCCHPNANYYDLVQLKCFAAFHGRLNEIDNINITSELRLLILLANNKHSNVNEFIKNKGGQINRTHLEYAVKFYLLSWVKGAINLCPQTLSALLQDKDLIRFIYLNINKGIVLKLIKTCLEKNESSLLATLLHHIDFNLTLDLETSKKLYAMAIEQNDFELQCIVIAKSHPDFAARNFINKDLFFELIKQEKYIGAAKIGVQGFINRKLSYNDIETGIILSHGNIFLIKITSGSHSLQVSTAEAQMLTPEIVHQSNINTLGHPVVNPTPSNPPLIFSNNSNHEQANSVDNPLESNNQSRMPSLG